MSRLPSEDPAPGEAPAPRAQGPRKVGVPVQVAPPASRGDGDPAAPCPARLPAA